METTINAGRVRFVSRGTYNNSTQYYLFDLVDYNGSSYIAKENTVGNLPTNNQYWQLIAEKGNTGNDGQQGPIGLTGNGIASITKTGTSGLVDTYTITYTNGNTTTFTITNGEDGEVTETELDVLREKVANQQKVIDQLPQVTGQGTSITLENTIEAQFTKFEIEGNSTQDGTPSPDNEVPIYSAGDNGSINEKIKNADGTEEQDYSIPVQQPMRSIGDVRDCFVKKDGNWYERHYIGEKILNGTEIWVIFNTHIYLYDDTFKASVENNYYVPNYKCNYFIPDSLSNANSSPNGKILQNVWGALAKHKGISFNSQDAFSDVATLKTWLSTHNVVVHYELEEPLDLPCTEEQIQQLENKPSTYKDFTYVTSEDETPAHLEVAGIYDLNNLINN